MYGTQHSATDHHYVSCVQGTPLDIHASNLLSRSQLLESNRLSGFQGFSSLFGLFELLVALIATLGAELAALHADLFPLRDTFALLDFRLGLSSCSKRTKLCW